MSLEKTQEKVKFRVIPNELISRMDKHAVVAGIGFNEFLAKIRHQDTGWRVGL